MCVCKPAFVQLYVFGITFFSYCTDCHLCCIWKLYTMLRWSLSLCSWSFFVCVSWFVAEYYSTNPNSTSPNMCTVAYSQLQPDVLVFVWFFQQFIYRLLYWTINSLLNCQHNNWFSTFKLLNVLNYFLMNLWCFQVFMVMFYYHASAQECWRAVLI